MGAKKQSRFSFGGGRSGGTMAVSADHSALIRQAVEGDTSALRELLGIYGPQIAGEMATQIGKQWQSVLEAEDVMQVTYLEAFMQISKLRGEDALSFISWLRRIATNNLRDAVKELGRKKRPQPANRVQPQTWEDSCVGLLEMLGTSSATPSRHVARNEGVQLMEEALQALPQDYQRVIRMYDLEGKSIADVSSAVNKSTGAVHMLRARAHDRLRDLLGSASRILGDTV
jgi:RNA polymerase sigma-70 factor (ECF subfamily)